jgi:hypothetical protein
MKRITMSLSRLPEWDAKDGPEIATLINYELDNI